MTPNLQHPVPVTISQIMRGAAEQDPDYRELVQATKGAPERTPDVVCPGQVKWNAKDAIEVASQGAIERADGYVVFRTADLRSVGIIALNINDVIKRIGSGPNVQDTYVYIIKLEPFGHYPSTGGASLIKAWFKDRAPSRG